MTIDHAAARKRADKTLDELYKEADFNRAEYFFAKHFVPRAIQPMTQAEVDAADAEFFDTGAIE